MALLEKIKRYISHTLPETDPETAYNLWAEGYDQQPDNLMLSLDNQVFSDLLSQVSFSHGHIIDVGCGTGRHWYELLHRQPDRLVGYDVSREMLMLLKQKFPGQEVHCQTGHLLNEPNGSFDLLVSTLTIAHISNATDAIREWHRVLKPGASMIITDFHPVALKKRGQRTFSHGGRLVAVKNYIHPVPIIIKTALSLGMELIELVERDIDDSMQGWYAKQDALPIFEKFRGTPIIYGCHLKKKDGIK